MNKVYVTDIFWDRIYLNFIIETTDIELDEIFLFLNRKIYENIKTKKIDENKYQAIINITNIKNSEMLQDGKYFFKYYDEAKKDFIHISITDEVGYKLNSLDKIYRYKKYHAYTLNFFAYDIEEGLICVLESMFMLSKKEPIKLKIKEKFSNFFKILFNGMYKLFDLLHQNKSKRILLMSETRSPISGNLKALNEEIKRREIDKKYRVSYSFCKTLELGKMQLLVNWIKLAWKISKQETIFIDDYSPIFKYIDLNKKKTKLIQVWHAGVGFKSVGYARFGFSGPEPYNSCHRKYDYAIVGSKGLIPVYSEVFGIDKEKILPYGLPRLDDFLSDEKINSTIKKLHDKYPILNGKKVILFAPTFRGKGQKDAHYPFDKIDLEKTYDMCNKNNYIFIFKMHPFIKSKIEIPEKFSDRIIDLSTYSDINDLLYLADILITDYSSTIYDFSMLNRPMLFYTFDLEKYEIINKVHRPIKEYAPGKICKTYDELINAINNQDFEVNKLQKYVEENFDKHDKKATDMIIDNLILKGDQND